MRGVLGGLLALCLSTFGCEGQTAFHAPRAVFIEPEAMRVLATNWDDTDPKQTERAYCGAVTVDTIQHFQIEYHLQSVHTPPVIRYPTPSSVYFECDSGLIKIHTHPPTTCKHGTLMFPHSSECAIGGDEAWECQPSYQDEVNLIHDHAATGDPVAFVQCDRHGVVPYFPMDADINHIGP
jgi:hypothetical protein